MGKMHSASRGQRSEVCKLRVSFVDVCVIGDKKGPRRFCQRDTVLDPQGYCGLDISREVENIKLISPLMFVKVLTVTTGCWRPRRSRWKGHYCNRAGRQDAERGLDRIEDKPINTVESATSYARYATARDGEKSGVGYGTGAAPTNVLPARRPPLLPFGRRLEGRQTVT